VGKEAKKNAAQFAAGYASTPAQLSRDASSARRRVWAGAPAWPAVFIDLQLERPGRHTTLPLKKQSGARGN